MRRIFSLIVVVILTTKATSQVTPPPTVGGFVTNDTIGCTPFLVNFQNFEANCISWHWDFGNGNTSSQENPIELFLTSGTYTITLDVIYTDGTLNHFERLNYINAIERPTALGTIGNYEHCLNTNNLQFQNNSIGTNQYLWGFGDGVFSTDIAPFHHYNMPGTYTTTLIATNSFGCSDNISLNNIQINSAVQNNVQILNSAPTCDSTFVYSFIESSAGILSCQWEFSDSSQFSGMSVQHAFNASGNFDLLLISEDFNGCFDSTFITDIVQITPIYYNFSASDTVNCQMRDVTFTATALSPSTFSWNFGDGSFGTGQIINHAYQLPGQYTVTITATDMNGCTQVLTKNNYIEIVQPPSANISLSDTIVCRNELINFELSNANTIAYMWNFGDGSNSNQPIVAHSYINSGIYVSYLEISSTGCADTLFQTVEVVQPTAQFTTPLSQNCPPINLTFTDQSNSAQSWQWNFSNGATSTDENPVINFNLPGDYDVELIVTDLNGCTDTSMVINAVNIANNTPINFQPTAFSGCSPIAISFYNYTIGNGYWNWSFGDSSTSSNQFPEHTYTSSGEYIVSLSSMDTLGCNIMIDTFAIVTVNSLIIDSINIDLQCDNSVVEFQAICTNCIEGNWNFGDGSYSTDSIVVHQYNVGNNFNVSYTGTSSSGCIGSMLNVVHLDSCSIGQSTPSASVPLVSVGNAGWTGDSSEINNAPLIEFCSPISIDFVNPFPVAQNLVWHFGDGEISYNQNPSHIYDSIGQFIVMLEFTINNVPDTLFFSSPIHVSGHTNDILISSIGSCYGLELDMVSADTSLVNYFWSIDNINVQNNAPFFDTILSNNNQVHSITLTTNDINNCTYSASVGIVSNGLNPGFAFNSPICLGDSLIIIHTVPENYQTSWSYGDDSTYSDPFHVYSSEGTFQIQAEVIDSGGCLMNFNLGEVTVVNPNSTFTITSPTDLCIGDTLVAEAIPDTNSIYNWTIENAFIPMGGSIISFIVQDSGAIDISLETSSFGCLSTTSQIGIATVHSPNADFSFTQSSVCLPILIQITDLSTSPISWEWNFGDSSTSSIQNPAHTYLFEPISLITLSIVDANGCASSISKNSIELFDIDISTSSNFACSPAPVTFFENSQNAINWLWNFGDSTFSSLQNPNHIYTTDGAFDVSLIATSQDGCVDSISYNAMVTIENVVADFSINVSGGCAPQPVYFTNNSINAVSWSWGFGNGFTSSLENPIQIYNTGGSYNVQLIAESTNGCVDTTNNVSPLTIIGPVSHFNVLDSTICAYDSVEFVNYSNNAASYLWLFGDGSSSSLISPFYQYTSTGNYNITLISYDSNGCQNIEMSNVLISVISAPNASFNLSDSVGCNPFLLNANANSSGLNYQWLLDSTMVGTGNSFITTLNSGNYSIGLIVQNQQGCLDSSAYHLIEVNPSYTVHLSPLLPICETQNTVSVSSSSVVGNWSINGISNPNSTFDISTLSPGDYLITKEIDSICGDSNSITLHIDSLISATISIPFSACENEGGINLQASSNLGFWSGNGITNPYLGIFDPSLTNYGTNQLTYTIVNGACIFTDSIIAYVNKIPQSNFWINNPALCEGKPIQIQATENDSIAIYNWTISSSVDTIYSSDITPSLTLSPGIWNFVLTVNEGVCSSTNSITEITVYDTIAPNTPDIIRSTVLGEIVLTEWTPPQYGAEKIISFEIWRSLDSITFSLIDNISNTEYTYLDDEVSVNSENYYYLIIPSNVCNVKPERKEMSSSILLKKIELDGNKLLFSWNKYFEWKDGVDFYELQLKDETGEWITVKKIDSNKKSVLIEKP